MLQNGSESKSLPTTSANQHLNFPEPQDAVPDEVFHGGIAVIVHNVFDHFPAAARILMAMLFLMSGIGKLNSIEATQEYMEAYGIPGCLIYPAAALEIGSGILLLIGGWVIPLLGIILSTWCVLTAMIFHRAWGDQNQLIHFMKNMTMAGGFLVLSEALRLRQLDRRMDSLVARRI